MTGDQAYALARKYVAQSLSGAGALKGDKGDPGQDGKDGFSPTIEAVEITGGHRVTVTDADGIQSFDVMDGKDGNDAVTPEAIQEAVDKYLNDNPVQSGATAEQAAQIEQNTADIEEIKKESESYITAEDFPSYTDVYGLLNESEVK